MKTTIQLLFCLLFFANANFLYAQTFEQRLKECEKQINILKNKTGQKGDKGDKGDSGDIGPQGPRGPRGYDGDKGDPGEPRDLKCLDISNYGMEIKPSGKKLFTFGTSVLDNGRLAIYDKSEIESILLTNGSATFYDQGVQQATIGKGVTLYSKGGGHICWIDEGVYGGGQIRLLNKRGEVKASLAMQYNGQASLEINGQTKDLAESFEIADSIGVVPGTVMTMKKDGVGTQPAKEAYDRKVVGVISTAGDLSPGMVLGSRADGSNNLPVAIAGQVYVRTNLGGGDITVGDLLVSSDKPGVAMKATDPMKAFGAVIGKALTPFTEKDLNENGEGLLLMLVMNH